MIVESGVIIFVGLMFIFIKLPRKITPLAARPSTRSRSLSLCARLRVAFRYVHRGHGGCGRRPDVLRLHALGRKAFGYVQRGVYYPGLLEDGGVMRTSHWRLVLAVASILIPRLIRLARQRWSR